MYREEICSQLGYVNAQVTNSIAAQAGNTTCPSTVSIFYVKKLNLSKFFLVDGGGEGGVRKCPLLLNALLFIRILRNASLPNTL